MSLSWERLFALLNEAIDLALANETRKKRSEKKGEKFMEFQKTNRLSPGAVIAWPSCIDTAAVTATAT